MSAWRGLSARVRGLMAIAAVAVAGLVVATITPFITCEDTAEARSTARAERMERLRVEQAEHRETLEAERQEWDRRFEEAMRSSTPAMPELRDEPERPARRIRRWQWESPVETRGRIWNVPEEESEEALLTALLRVCIAEADGNPQDCAGIWQVVRNNRRRSCDRGTNSRITECFEDGGETYLSALRRHQRHVLGMIKARTRRAAWVSKLTPECEMPDGYPGGENHWYAHYGSKVCPQTVADARRLIAGELPEPRPGERVRWLPDHPITWGGRCEANGGACDDHLACARGLVRIKGTNTLNAFWRRSRGPDDVEPVCEQLLARR